MKRIGYCQFFACVFFIGLVAGCGATVTASPENTAVVPTAEVKSIPENTVAPPAPTEKILPADTSVPVAPAGDTPVKPGKWSGTAEFGTLSFLVTEAGTGIPYVEYTFENYQCGNATSSGTIGNGQETGWEGVPITGGKFLFDGSTMMLEGEFDAAGTSASGTWTYPDCSTSGEWQASPLQ